MKALNDSIFWKEYVEAGRLESVYVIDTHTHMDDIYEASTPIYQLGDCIELMDRENIRSIWCAPHPDLFSAGRVNERIERYMSQYPDRVKGYFSWNPNYFEDYEKNIHKVLEIENYIGFKFLPVYHNVELTDERYLPALEMADAHNLILLSHTWGNTGCSPKQVKQILEKYKNLQFILGHSAPNELDGAIELVKKYDNAYLDLCDIHRHSGIVDKMANCVGSEKILFGTDLPWYDPNYCIGSILCSKLSDDQKENIFYKNAERMLSVIKKENSNGRNY